MVIRNGTKGPERNLDPTNGSLSYLLLLPMPHLCGELLDPPEDLHVLLRHVLSGHRHWLQLQLLLLLLLLLQLLLLLLLLFLLQSPEGAPFSTCHRFYSRSQVSAGTTSQQQHIQNTPLHKHMFYLYPVHPIISGDCFTPEGHKTFCAQLATVHWCSKRTDTGLISSLVCSYETYCDF